MVRQPTKRVPHTLSSSPAKLTIRLFLCSIDTAAAYVCLTPLAPTDRGQRGTRIARPTSPSHKMAVPSMSSKFMAFVNSPTGPRTTHFWGPVANWGFVLAVSICQLPWRAQQAWREHAGRKAQFTTPAAACTGRLLALLRHLPQVVPEHGTIAPHAPALHAQRGRRHADAERQCPSPPPNLLKSSALITCAIASHVLAPRAGGGALG